MSKPFIVDAHVHTGTMRVMFAPRTTAHDLLSSMDRLGIHHAVHCGSMAEIFVQGSSHQTLTESRRVFEESEGRVYYLGVFHPAFSGPCLKAIEEAIDWPGFSGLKILPSPHGVFGSDPVYRAAWQFAADHDVALLTHSWSVSDYNPVQHLSTPDKFEEFVREFPAVRFVLGHAGGRGTGQQHAIRMARDYPNVYLDFSGDIYCYRLIERLVASVPSEKILFGSDFPMFDLSANLSRVLLAKVDEAVKRKILRENAMKVYKL